MLNTKNVLRLRRWNFIAGLCFSVQLLAFSLSAQLPIWNAADQKLQMRNGASITFDTASKIADEDRTPQWTIDWYQLQYLASLRGPAQWNTGSFVFTNVLVSNMTAGTNDIFTVPSGQRFALIGLNVGTTNTASSTANFSLVKTNGSYWKLASSSSLSDANPIPFAVNISSFIYDNNETVAVFAGKDGFSCWCSGFLFANTLPYFSVKRYDVAAGTNTFYTAPSGKLATSANLLIAPIGSSTATFGIANDSSVTTHLWLVPSGSSYGVSNYFRKVTSGGAVTPHTSLPLPAWMQAGDSLTVGTTATTGLIYLTVFEK